MSCVALEILLRYLLSNWFYKQKSMEQKQQCGLVSATS